MLTASTMLSIVSDSTELVEVLSNDSMSDNGSTLLTIMSLSNGRMIPTPHSELFSLPHSTSRASNTGPSLQARL